MESEHDIQWMRRALVLAEQGRFTVSPNPMVGCVLVRDGQVVGEGWHERAGGPHAEIVALEQAGERARGATAYVTLEPCAHTGRTGPCADALRDAGVARVVAAMADPNPVAAGGAATLRAAGIPVDIGACGDDAARQNEVFLHGLAHDRPFVTVKSALSVDGRIAAADGTSQWLTGPDTRILAHELRAQADAILVGSGTVLADNPALTVRLPGFHGSAPLRVVMDARARTPLDSAVLDGAAPTLIAVAEHADPRHTDALRARGADVAVLPAGADGSGINPAALLALLAQRGVRSLLVEGGAHVAAGFLREGLWDRLVLHIAGLLLGAEGLPLHLGAPIATLADAPRLRLDHVRQSGDDVVLTYRPPKSGAARAHPDSEGR